MEDQLDDLKVRGVSTLISLLTPQDISELGMQREAELWLKKGLRFINCPVVDYGLPQGPGFTNTIASVLSDLSQGVRCAVHCKAGIGRSGMLACCLLIALGQKPAQALATVSAARDHPVPETSEQKRFILRYTHRTQRLQPETSCPN
ncbi:MAG: hypothetical protein AAF755_00190 [Pseudomonadota bacterium]